LAVTVGLCSGLAGYVIHVAQVRRTPKQFVQVRRLTTMTGLEESPAISPDGNAVAFVALSDSSRQIWVVSTWFDGGPPHVISEDAAEHSAPRWSSDSSKLIYFAQGAVWEIPARGGDGHRLVDALAPGDLSHAGKKLAFFRFRDGATELAVDDRTIIKLDGGTYSNLRWSPDDKQIAFLQDMKVMVVSTSGGDPVRASDVTAQGFTWAPDNSGLIVSTGGELWFIPRKEGTGPSQLTFGELSYESPDIGAGGNLVVSRRSPFGPDSDIIMFSGLKW
jgi:Tol biopolymer transport system component